MMNAIDFLTTEHTRVKNLLADITKDSHQYETKRKMLNALCNDLMRHETMEHEVWYPHFRKNEHLDDTVKHLLTEEKHAEKAMRAFDSLKTEKEWEEKFKEFKKDVEHHAHEEETKLFPLVKKILSEEKLKSIGKEMQAFKKEYREE